MKKLSVYVLAIAVLAVSGTSVFSSEKLKVDTKAIFEQKCSICHDLDRSKSKRKTSKEWERTVMRMKNAHGCPITDREAKNIIDYLSQNYGR